MFQIQQLSALEILDSRGRPTVKATCQLKDGHVASASVPSGASTGAAEALELRDGDPKRFGGLGCLAAVANVNGVINASTTGQRFEDQAAFDRALLSLDGTVNKSRLGANAILASSLAFARACAKSRSIPLYQHFSETLGQKPRFLPRFTINLFSGGKHAGGQAPIQDLLVVPLGKTTIECLNIAYQVYQAAAELILRKYQMRLLRADEGGLAPPFSSVEAMFEDAMAAIANAGLVEGRDVVLAIDVASTHFYRDGHYDLGQRNLTSEEMISTIATWVRTYPIVSVEDGLHEEDWMHWPELTRVIGDRALVVGDDLLCTNPARIEKAIGLKAANALLLKVNQIGCVTEALQSLALARGTGWQVTISARSGETEDDWLADLAVGWSADQIKIGSITQSERLSKYNRLLEIEKETGLPMSPWPSIADS